MSKVTRIRERRNNEAYKLRVYVDAIRDAEALTPNQWIEMQSQSNAGYISRESWIGYLKDCAIREGNRLARDTLKVA